MRLDCGYTNMNGRQELWWERQKKNNYLLLQMASGIYLNRTLIDVFYNDRLVEGRSELSPDGSLTIHSYEDKDSGNYSCHTKHGSAWSDVTTFSKYVLIVHKLCRLDLVRSKVGQ